MRLQGVGSSRAFCISGLGAAGGPPRALLRVTSAGLAAFVSIRAPVSLPHAPPLARAASRSDKPAVPCLVARVDGCFSSRVVEGTSWPSIALIARVRCSDACCGGRRSALIAAQSVLTERTPTHGCRQTRPTRRPNRPVASTWARCAAAPEPPRRVAIPLGHGFVRRVALGVFQKARAQQELGARLGPGVFVGL